MRLARYILLAVLASFIAHPARGAMRGGGTGTITVSGGSIDVTASSIGPSQLSFDAEEEGQVNATVVTGNSSTGTYLKGNGSSTASWGNFATDVAANDGVPLSSLADYGNPCAALLRSVRRNAANSANECFIAAGISDANAFTADNSFGADTGVARFRISRTTAQSLTASAGSSSTQITAQASSPYDSSYKAITLSGTAGLTVLTATPTIETAGVSTGRKLIIENTDATAADCAVLQDKGVLASSALRLAGHATRTLCPGDAFLSFTFNGTDWVEDAGPTLATVTSTLPATCHIGDPPVLNSTAALGSRFNVCIADNTWVAIDNPFGLTVDAAEMANSLVFTGSHELDLFTNGASLRVQRGATAPTAQGGLHILSTTNKLEYNYDGTNSAQAATTNRQSTFTAAQTFNDSIAIALGTGANGSLSYDGTNVVLDPDAVGTGSFSVTGKASIAADTATYTAALNELQVGGSLSLDYTNPQYNVIKLQGTKTYESNPTLGQLSSGINVGVVYNNPSGESRDLSNAFITGVGSSVAIQANTQTGQTLPTVNDITSNIAVTSVSSGTFTAGGVFTNAVLNASVAPGNTVSSRTGLSITNMAGAGSLTTQVGLKVANMAKGSTNWAAQFDGGNSYHVGKVELGGTGTPTWDLSLDGTAARQLGVEDRAGNNAANGLTISGSSVTTSATDKAGGDIVLASGGGAGTGGSKIDFKTSVGGSTGTTVRTAATQLRLRDGHLVAMGTALAAGDLSGCGTNPTIVGNDIAGKITLGAGSPTACVLTFKKAYTTNAPVCVANNETSNTATRIPKPSTSTTALTLTATFTAADVLDYYCIGVE